MPNDIMDGGGAVLTLEGVHYWLWYYIVIKTLSVFEEYATISLVI